MPEAVDDYNKTLSAGLNRESTHKFTMVVVANTPWASLHRQKYEQWERSWVHNLTT